MANCPKYLPVGKAIENLTGSRPHPSTVWRWALKGSGGRVLKTWMVGGRRMTTAEAVQEFIEGRQQPTEATPAKVDKVKAELKKLLG